MKIRRGAVYWWNCPPASQSRPHIQQGIRPVVVVSNEDCNENSPVVTVVPFTSRIHRPFPQQVPVVFNGDVSVALCEQVTSVPITELGGFIGNLCGFQVDQVDTALAIQLGFVSVKDRPYAPAIKKN